MIARSPGESTSFIRDVASAVPDRTKAFDYSRSRQQCLAVLVVTLRNPPAESGITEAQTGLFAKNKDSEESIMKLASIIVAAALAISAVSSFAQSNQPLTRAEVKAQLVQLERTGYNPSTEHSTYPVAIQAAEAKVAAQNGQNSYGGVSDRTSASGSYRVPAYTGNKDVNPVYRGH